MYENTREYPSEQPNNLSWDEFWGDGRILDYNYQPTDVVPREYQPSSHVRLGDTLLGEVALRRYAQY